MATSFSIARSDCSTLPAATLRAEIQSHTGNDAETSSILRSLERFGDDTSIRYYEVTPTEGRRVYYAASASVWTVRAVR